MIYRRPGTAALAEVKEQPRSAYGKACQDRSIRAGRLIRDPARLHDLC